MPILKNYFLNTFVLGLQRNYNSRVYMNLMGIPSLYQENLDPLQAGSFQSPSVFQILGRPAAI